MLTLHWNILYAGLDISTAIVCCWVTDTLVGHVQEILNELEKAISDRELLEVVAAERDDLPYIKASANRLIKDDYDRINVGDYKEKARNRTATQTRQRKKYEVWLQFLVGNQTLPFNMDLRFASCECEGAGTVILLHCVWDSALK